MQKKSLIILLSLLLPCCFFALLFFRLASSAPRIVKAYYPNLQLQLFGEETNSSPASFSCLYGSSHAFTGSQSLPEIARHLSLVFNHVSYPVDALTSESMKSLGFSVQDVAPGCYHMNLYPWPLYGLFRFKRGQLYEFSIGDLSTTSTFAFSYQSGPEKKLPLSQAEMETIFGKPDKIEKQIDTEYIIKKIFDPPARLLFPPGRP